MASTFPNIAPSYGSSVNEKVRVKEIKFGDGYAQESADGINNVVLVANLQFTSITDAELATITAFLRAQSTPTPTYFLWTPNLNGYNTQKKWKCRAWDNTPIQYNCNNFVAVFTQCFDL